MSVSKQQVLDSLRRVNYPGFNRDLVSLDAVRNLSVAGDRVSFELSLGALPAELAGSIERQAHDAVASLSGVATVEIRGAGSTSGSPSLKVVGGPQRSAAAGGAADPGLIPQVRHTVAVASGKGGVGKSTVAVNLAAALQRLGLKVGLLDADLYGPSVPIMIGLRGARAHAEPGARTVPPFERFGVRFMSLGFLIEPDAPVIWRGPMVMKALEQLLRDVSWGELDVLVVDMPPGTGDAQLTMSQRVNLAGAVIVTTPQDVALADAIKGVAMFRSVEVPVLGIVENMSYFHCPHCSERTDIFGHGGGRAQAERLDVPFLGEVPLDPVIRDSGDSGEPVVVASPESDLAGAFVKIAEQVRDVLDPTPGDDERGGIFDRFRNLLGERKPTDPPVR